MGFFGTILAVAVIYVAVHLVISGFLFFMLWFDTANRIQTGEFDEELKEAPSGWIEAWIAEGLASAWLIALLPLGWLGLRNEKTNADLGNEAPPVLFVHGWMMNGSCWWPMIRQLKNRRKNRRLYTMSLHPVFASISAYHAQVHERVEMICRMTGHDKVVLVGHSMGGLIIRNYLAEYGPERVEKAISLGSPHHGTRLAVLSHSRNGRQMKLNTEFYRDLERRDRYKEVEFHSFYSVHDNYVLPFTTSKLEGAQNHRLEGYGHTRLQVATEITDNLEKLIYSSSFEKATDGSETSPVVSASEG